MFLSGRVYFLYFASRRGGLNLFSDFPGAAPLTGARAGV